MGVLNFQNDLFLGLQELKRWDKINKDDGYVRLFKSIINNFGIVDVDIDSSFNNFKVQGGTNTGTIKVGIDSYAVDKNLDIIYQKAKDNIAVTDDNTWYWVKVSYQESNIEEGTINLAANGNITGINTIFTDVLRDQSSYPVKINFPESSLNTGDYQVVSILSDTSAIITGSGSGFVSENGLKYRVVGSFTPGISITGDDRLPYIYDSCKLEFVVEVSENVPPSKTSGTEFYIARVKNSSGTITVQDKRTEILGVAKTDTGWVQPTLNAEFTNVSGNEIEYRKNYLGEIELRGAFTTTLGTATLFTLPEGFRPNVDIQGLYGYSDGSVIRVVTVDTDGLVKASTSFPFHTSNTNVIMSLRFKTI